MAGFFADRRPVPRWTPRPLPPAEALVGERVRLEPLSAGRHAAGLFAGICGPTGAAQPGTAQPDPITGGAGSDRPPGRTGPTAGARIWDFMSYGPFDTEAGYADWIRSVEGRPDPQFFAVLDRRGRARGVVSYLRIDPGNGVCELGNIVFAPDLQQSAEATEALHLMAARAFDLGYRRFEWKCNAANLPSRRAAERLGFSYEGTFRNHMVIKGENRDTAWFAMTDADWPAIKAAHRQWLDPRNFDAAGRQKQSLSALTGPLLVARDPALAGARGPEVAG